MLSLLCILNYISFVQFFLSLNLTKVSFSSNDNIYIIFKANKNAFKSKNIYYSYSSSSNFNYNINGIYSICQTEIKEDEEDNINISCLISKKSNNPLAARQDVMFNEVTGM